MFFKKQSILLFLTFGLSVANKVTFYGDYNREGPRLRLSYIDSCVALPNHWHWKVSSIDTHNNCFIFYDTPICKGNFIQVKLSGEDPRIIDNLKVLGFNDVIKSFKPCPTKYVLPTGDYKIQNTVNGKYLTVRDLQIVGWTKLKTTKWKRQDSQKWQVSQNPDGTYFLIPLAHLDKFPITDDLHIFDREVMADVGLIRNHDAWNLIYLHGNIALIRNHFSKECLTADGTGDISQTRCNAKSRYQQWIFHDL